MLRLSMFNFLIYAGFSVIVFFLPLYFQAKGLSATEIGLVVAAGALISIFAQPFWGIVSDKKKTVKKILILVLATGAVISIGLFTMTNVLPIFLFMLAFMFFMSSVPPLTDSLTLKYAQEHGKNFGLIRSWGEVGVGLSAILVGLLIELAGIQYLGFIYIFFVLIVLASTRLIQDTTRKVAPVTKEALKTLFSNPGFLWFLFLILMVAIPHRMNDSLLALYISDLGGRESQVGRAWTIATLSSVPTLAFMGYLIRRYNELLLFVIASFIYVLRWWLYGMATSPGALVYLQVLHMLTFPVFFVAAITYIARIVPEELRATGQTSFAAVFGGIAGILGSAVGGWAMDTFGAEHTYKVGSLLALIGAIAACITYFATRKDIIKSKITEQQ